ncbi:helix-turn-helix transcriptional regulator [Solibacillus silvestris]
MKRTSHFEGGKLINKLKEHRHAYELTQNQLAELVHVSQRTIISLEKGQYKPSILLAYRLALLFNTSIEDLFCLEKNKHQEDLERENL